jgi:hypothetical protein
MSGTRNQLFEPLQIQQPDSQQPSPADAWTANTKLLTDWLNQQQQISADRGLWQGGQPWEGGGPTGAGVVNAAGQWASGIQPGTIAGVGAATADTAALAKAQQMAARGVGRDDILSETGWFRGPDGHWRFEINDQGMTVNRSIPDETTLGAAVNHPELFAAYPEMANTRVIAGGDRGVYYSAKGSGDPPIIGLPPVRNPEGVMLHEMQHNVQDIEGFERGGSSSTSPARPEFGQLLADRIRKITTPLSYDEYAQAAWGGEKSADSLADYNNTYLKTVPKSVDLYSDFGRQLQQDVAREVYMNLHGEVEARAVQSRMNQDPAARRDAGPWWSYDVPESQHIVRNPAK